MLEKVVKTIKKSPLEFVVVFFILALALFLRVYRIDELLGFYYDQGRDALVIRDLIHNGKFFLIGPTTGIEGIFRGPFYYYLITPFYWLGNGNPVYPSVFLSFTTVVAIGLAYFLTRKVGGRVPAALVLLIASVSHYFVSSSRWLSNPTPMFFISMIYVGSLFLINKGKGWAILLAVFAIGMAMQFGSAAEIFYIPSFMIVLYINRKKLPKARYLVFSFLLIALIFTPQIVFDVRHDGVISKAIVRFLVNDKSFDLSFWQILQTRMAFYYDVIVSKFWIESKVLSLPFVLVSVLVGWVGRKELFRNRNFTTLLIVLLTPFLGMMFFQGNQGNVYDYYFTGYYLIILMVFSVLIARLFKSVWGKIIILMFVGTFLFINIRTLKDQLFINMDSKKAIVLGNELKAIDWIYNDVGDRDFNIDVYVPPVIPYAYDYLLLWRGDVIGKLPNKNLSKQLYTIYEEDDFLPTRLTKWQERQNGIGEIVKGQTFGGVTVQERVRYEKINIR